MTSSRPPARPTYDAVVLPFPWDGPARVALAIVKQTFAIEGGRVIPSAAEPLQHDIRDPAVRRAHPRGSDYAPKKPGADIVVVGTAHPRGAASRVDVRVGPVRKSARVFGRRVFRLAPSARIEHVDAPGPTSLGREAAFGGGKPRCTDEARAEPVLRHLAGARAGLAHVYPRNPYGVGFYDEEAASAPGFTVELPRLEDPNDRLTVDRLVALPRRPWWEAPLPWCFDWMGFDQFPRAMLVSPGETPDPTLLAEVTRELWPATWLAMSVESLESAALFREAALGMVGPPTGWDHAPVELGGVLPEGEPLEFHLPRAPRIEVGFEGDAQLAEPQLTQLVLRPDVRALTMTWVAWRTDLPRAFVPGLHGVIPFSVIVDGDAAIRYTTPPTARAIRAAQQHAAPRASVDAVDLVLPNSGAPRRDRDLVPVERAEMAGDIDAATGRLLLVETDYELPSAVRFALRRHYSSSMAWRTGPLGRGWSHVLEEAVWHEDGWLLYRTGDGRELALPVPSGGELGLLESTHHPVDGVTIACVAPGAFEVWHEDGRHTHLELVPETVQFGPVRARPTRLFALDGASLRVRYDAHGRLARLDWAEGRGLRFEHDARGRLSRVYAPAQTGGDVMAVAARYDYDAVGQLRTVFDAAGERTRYRYADGRIREQILPNGLRRQFRYDTEGERCVAEVVDDSGKTRLVERGGSTIRVADAEGRWRSLEIDEGHRVKVVRDPFGRETRLTYDASTGLLVERETHGATTTLLYDAHDHVADLTLPDAGSVSFEHDVLGRLTSVRHADGALERWRWDEAGRLAGVTLPNGVSEVYGYTEGARLETIVLPTGLEARLDRDESGGVVAIRSAAGFRYASRDALGRVSRVTDEAGASWQLAYDPCGRLTQIEHPGGLVERFDTDTEGRVRERRRPLERTVSRRDDHGRVIEVGDGEASLHPHRDGEGHVTLVESETHDFWEMERDAAGRLTDESRFDGSERAYVRRDGGRIVRAAAGPSRTRVERDRVGRPTAYEHGDHTFQRFEHTPGGRVRRAQDADHVLELAHDGLGRPLFERAARSSVESTYGPFARRRLSASTGLSVEWERDGLGRATQLVARMGGAVLTLGFERDACGRERRRALPGDLTLCFERDALGRVLERRVEHAGRRLATLRFEHAGLTRLARVVDPERGVREARYDGRGRLIGLGGQRRPLDAGGNLQPGDARHGANGQVLEVGGTRYRYDEAGRRIEREDALGEIVRYAWDDAGRLTGVQLSASTRVSYRYDAFGRMIERRLEHRIELDGIEDVWEPTRVTAFVWDGLTLLSEIEGDAVTTWVWDGGELVGSVGSEGPRAILIDPFGRPTEMIDAGGNLVWKGSVDLFGDAVVELDGARMPWRMPGYWADPDTGLLCSFARVYDPEIAAHLSPSPLGVAGGSNLYGDAPDPLMTWSPLGLGAGLSATLGAVPPEGLDAERVLRAIGQLDRQDGSAGPRGRFDPEAAAVRLPDPEALLFGAWADARPSVRAPVSAWGHFVRREPHF